MGFLLPGTVGAVGLLLSALDTTAAAVASGNRSHALPSAPPRPPPSPPDRQVCYAMCRQQPCSEWLRTGLWTCTDLAVLGCDCSSCCGPDAVPIHAPPASPPALPPPIMGRGGICDVDCRGRTCGQWAQSQILTCQELSDFGCGCRACCDALGNLVALDDATPSPQNYTAEWYATAARGTQPPALKGLESGWWVALIAAVCVGVTGCIVALIVVWVRKRRVRVVTFSDVPPKHSSGGNGKSVIPHRRRKRRAYQKVVVDGITMDCTPRNGKGEEDDIIGMSDVEDGLPGDDLEALTDECDDEGEADGDDRKGALSNSHLANFTNAFEQVHAIARKDEDSSLRDVEVDSLIHAMTALTASYTIIGEFMAPLVDNDKKNITCVSAANERHGRCSTLRGLLVRERDALTNNGAKPYADGVLPQGSAALAMVWMVRSLGFWSGILNALLDDESMPLQAAVYASYDAHLSPFHGWVLRGVFRLGIKAVPSRETFFSRLGNENSLLRRYRKASGLVREGLIRLLDDLNVKDTRVV